MYAVLITNNISRRYDYCSMLVELDDKLAEMRDVLGATGLWNNSLVFLTSDNGGMTNWAMTNAEPSEPAFPGSAGSNW